MEAIPPHSTNTEIPIHIWTYFHLTKQQTFLYIINKNRHGFDSSTIDYRLHFINRSIVPNIAVIGVFGKVAAVNDKENQCGLQGNTCSMYYMVAIHLVDQC